MDFVQQLRVFVTVVEHGSFSRAAQNLSMGRPTVTHTVNALEKEMGVRLLHRNTRNMSLTSEGSEFFDRATDILASVSDVRHLFGDNIRAPHGRLRIDMPNSVAKPIIIPRLGSFFQRYPGIDLALGINDRPVDLVAEGVDCVLRVGEIQNSSLISSVVAQLNTVTVAAPSYIAEHGQPKTLEDLRDHRAVTYFIGHTRRILDWSFDVGGVRKTVRMKPSLHVNDGDAYISCALEGFGLAQATRLALQNDIDSGRFVEILPHFKSPTRPLSVLYPAKRHLAPQVRVFIDWAKEIFQHPDARWASNPKA